jgi:hypothetical protein
MLLGPTLIVDVGFDPNFDPNSSKTPPVSQLQGSHALVDTGATISCIDSAVAAALSLPVIDRQKISGAGGLSEYALSPNLRSRLELYTIRVLCWR